MRQKLGDPTGLLTLGSIFFLLGVGLSGANLLVSVPRWMLAASGSVATGKVVALERTTKGNVRPVVEFTPPRGTPVRTTMTVGTRRESYPIGREIEVYYDADRPQRNVVNTFSELWFFCILLGGMGAMWLLAATPILLLWLGRWWARARVRERGWHAAGRVVNCRSHVGKGTYRYDYLVEGVDPITQTVGTFWSDRTDRSVGIGAPAVIHLEPSPPYRYFVELRLLGADGR